MCDWMTSSDKIHSTRYCREAEKLVDVIFGQWESATNNWVNDNFLLSTRHIESLDQWHAVLNSILFKRSWEMESHVINSIQNFLKDSVKSIRQNYKTADFAQKDSRFKYLYHWKLDLSDSDILYIMLISFIINKCELKIHPKGYLNKRELYFNNFNLCILGHVSGFGQWDFFGLYACIRRLRYLKSLRGQFVDQQKQKIWF